MGRSEAVTEGIRVVVNASYVPERSAPERDLYYFAYRVKISNEGETAARLVTRHWAITDARGGVEHLFEDDAAVIKAFSEMIVVSLA